MEAGSRKHHHRVTDSELMEAMDGNHGLFDLWGAVLLQAIEDFHRKGPGFEIVMNGIRLHGLADSAETRRNKRNADAWFKSSREDVGSFIWICDLFKLDADRVRVKIKNKNFKLTR